tara:strand:- start:2525 stop:2905 length:381 start_codon:yes stop_codon:yes gene_type:complete
MRKFKHKLRLGVGIFAIIASFLGITQGTERTVTLTWTVPIERTDGTPLDAVVRYDIDCTTGESAQVTDTAHTFSTNNYGDHSCSLVVVASDGEGGLLSSQPTSVSFNVAIFLTQPKPATNFKAEVQ